MEQNKSNRIMSMQRSIDTNIMDYQYRVSENFRMREEEYNEKIFALDSMRQEQD